MSDVFSESPEPDSPKETSKAPTAKDYLESLRPNWKYFNNANRIIRIQDAYDIAQSQGMEKDEFCELVSVVLIISIATSKLLLDSIRPINQSLLADVPIPINDNSQLTEALREAEAPSGVISAQKLHKAYRLAKENGLSKRQFIFKAADVLRSQEIVIRTILEDPHFNKNTHRASSAEIVVKKSVEPPRKPKSRKPVQQPRTYKSRRGPTKPPKEKGDFEVLALRSNWDRLNHYERMATVRDLINRLKTNSPLPVAINMMAQRLNRSENIIATYYHLAGIRKEIIELLEKEQIDTPTAIQVESILDGSKNIDSQKLFAALSELNQMITIEVFRDILQDCFEKSARDWKRRVSVCRIKPDWGGDGEVLREYELTYIPFDLLTDEEKKRFHFTSHREEAYVTFQLGGEDRYSKVPMEALEPIRIKIGG
ncbi:hypothetical protein KKA33_03745 [Patescibacteria group bacterium]|nr:hypothetical protein [Patescibacteria group bacterium]